jgi:hypothetical protein
MDTNALINENDPEFNDFKKDVEQYAIFWEEKCQRIEAEATTKLLRGSLELEREKRAHSELLNTHNKAIMELETMKRHFFNLLDEWEATFDNDESYFSYESMRDYVDAATYAHRKHGRPDYRIRHVEEKMGDLPW